MTLNLRELVAALPEEAERSTSSEEALQRLAMKLAQRRVPVGSLARLWSLGSMNAKVALAYVAYWLRSSYQTTDERQRSLNEAHLTAAIRLLGGMSYLRGAIMKVGQTLAAYPKILPQEFVEALGKLHFDAPPMHFALLREQVRNELGADPEDLFASFEPTAFAAASLGQVHRATLKTGERVAVKIQYPAIDRTIRADLRNLMAFLNAIDLGLGQPAGDAAGCVSHAGAGNGLLAGGEIPASGAGDVSRRRGRRRAGRFREVFDAARADAGLPRRRASRRISGEPAVAGGS